MWSPPKSTHLWSDSPPVSPGCCSGAALLLSFPWYVPDFRKITTRPADGNLSAVTARQPARVLLPQMSPVFRSGMCGASAAVWMAFWWFIMLFICNCGLDKGAVALISHQTQSLRCDLKRTAHHKKIKKLHLFFFLFLFLLFLISRSPYLSPELLK